MLNKERLLTPLQVAQRLQISRHTVWRAIRNGDLPAFKIGNTIYRIREDSLKKYLRNSKNS